MRNRLHLLACSHNKAVASNNFSLVSSSPETTVNSNYPLPSSSQLLICNMFNHLASSRLLLISNKPCNSASSKHLNLNLPKHSLHSKQTICSLLKHLQPNLLKIRCNLQSSLGHHRLLQICNSLQTLANQRLKHKLLVVLCLLVINSKPQTCLSRNFSRMNFVNPKRYRRKVNQP